MLGHPDEKVGELIGSGHVLVHTNNEIGDILVFLL